VTGPAKLAALLAASALLGCGSSKPYVVPAEYAGKMNDNVWKITHAPNVPEADSSDDEPDEPPARAPAPKPAPPVTPGAARPVTPGAAPAVTPGAAPASEPSAHPPSPT
jgi:hypothetical protein